MTRVCVRCGWLVLDGPRCRRDDGPTLSTISAGRLCGVRSLRDLLHLEPDERLRRFDIAREVFRTRAGRPAAGELAAAGGRGARS